MLSSVLLLFFAYSSFFAPLIRVGRLDRLVHVPPPSAQERADILIRCCRRVQLHKSVTADSLSSLMQDGTAGKLTGADIDGLVSNAALICANRALTRKLSGDLGWTVRIALPKVA
jgi:ATP-dependent 26S proteasome regulatory subunit